MKDSPKGKKQRPNWNVKWLQTVKNLLWCLLLEVNIVWRHLVHLQRVNYNLSNEILSFRIFLQFKTRKFHRFFHYSNFKSYFIKYFVTCRSLSPECPISRNRSKCHGGELSKFNPIAAKRRLLFLHPMRVRIWRRPKHI